MAAPAKRGSTVIGVLTLIAGAVVIGSTFFSWIWGTGVFSSSAWNGLVHTTGSNFLYTSGEGVIFFSGFWSLLVGVLLVVAGIIAFFRVRIGGAFALVFGMIGTGIAAVNIVMCFTKMSPLETTYPGVGLWVFAGLSLAGLVLGIVGVSSSG